MVPTSILIKPWVYPDIFRPKPPSCGSFWLLPTSNREPRLLSSTIHLLRIRFNSVYVSKSSRLVSPLEEKPLNQRAVFCPLLLPSELGSLCIPRLTGAAPFPTPSTELAHTFDTSGLFCHLLYSVLGSPKVSMIFIFSPVIRFTLMHEVLRF